MRIHEIPSRALVQAQTRQAPIRWRTQALRWLLSRLPLLLVAAWVGVLLWLGEVLG